jgi:hypothetical protein
MAGHKFLQIVCRVKNSLKMHWQYLSKWFKNSRRSRRSLQTINRLCNEIWNVACRVSSHKFVNDLLDCAFLESVYLANLDKQL